MHLRGLWDAYKLCSSQQHTQGGRVAPYGADQMLHEYVMHGPLKRSGCFDMKYKDLINSQALTDNSSF